MKTKLLRSTMWLAAVFAAAAIFGCAEVQTEWDKFQRGTPVRKTGYLGQKDRITFSPPLIQPGTVARGEKLSYQISYTLHSPDESKEFLVVEEITLSGSHLHMELSRKIVKKRQGNHVMKIEFNLPPDLWPGPYEIMSTVRIGELEKQQSGRFTLEQREMPLREQ